MCSYFNLSSRCWLSLYSYCIYVGTKSQWSVWSCSLNVGFGYPVPFVILSHVFVLNSLCKGIKSKPLFCHKQVLIEMRHFTKNADENLSFQQCTKKVDRMEKLFLWNLLSWGKHQQWVIELLFQKQHWLIRFLSFLRIANAKFWVIMKAQSLWCKNSY